MGQYHNLGRFDFLVNDNGELLEIRDNNYGVKYNAFTCLAFNQVFEAAAKLLSREQAESLLEDLKDEALTKALKDILA